MGFGIRDLGFGSRVEGFGRLKSFKFLSLQSFKRYLPPQAFHATLSKSCCFLQNRQWLIWESLKIVSVPHNLLVIALCPSVSNFSITPELEVVFWMGPQSSTQLMAGKLPRPHPTSPSTSLKQHGVSQTGSPRETQP